MPSPRPPVSIDAIVEALEFQSDSLGAFLLPATGEIVLVGDEALNAAERPDGVAWVDDEELEAAQRVRAAAGALPLPDRFEVDEYDMMVRFASSRPSSLESDALRDALHGQRAFRRFKDRCHALGLAGVWYAFRDAEYERVAVRWCETHGLAWTRAEVSRGPDA